MMSTDKAKIRHEILNLLTVTSLLLENKTHDEEAFFQLTKAILLLKHEPFFIEEPVEWLRKKISYAELLERLFILCKTEIMQRKTITVVPYAKDATLTLDSLYCIDALEHIFRYILQKSSTLVITVEREKSTILFKSDTSWELAIPPSNLLSLLQKENPYEKDFSFWLGLKVFEQFGGVCIHNKQITQITFP